MQNQVKIKTTYNIQVGPYDLVLNQEEVEDLFNQLENILKKKKQTLKDYFPPMQPYNPAVPIVPKVPKHNDWTIPHTPTWPPYGPPIYCEQPISICSL